jgi:hypothetical protein
VATKKKTKRKTKKDKELIIEVKAKDQVKMGKVSFYKFDKQYWLRRDKLCGKPAPNEDELICVTDKTVVSDVFVDGEAEKVSVMCRVASKDLKKLVKKLKKQEKYFKKKDKKRRKQGLPLLGDRFFIHLNPELSFFIEGEYSE